MKATIIACAALLALGLPSFAESPAPAHDHSAPAVKNAEPTQPPASTREQAQQPDLMELMTAAGETLHADHGDDHSNCCKIKKPAQ